jgi:hypothetical protein
VLPRCRGRLEEEQQGQIFFQFYPEFLQGETYLVFHRIDGYVQLFGYFLVFFSIHTAHYEYFAAAFGEFVHGVVYKSFDVVIRIECAVYIFEGGEFHAQFLPVFVGNDFAAQMVDTFVFDKREKVGSEVDLYVQIPAFFPKHHKYVLHNIFSIFTVDDVFPGKAEQSGKITDIYLVEIILYAVYVGDCPFGCHSFILILIDKCSTKFRNCAAMLPNFSFRKNRVAAFAAENRVRQVFRMKSLLLRLNNYVFFNHQINFL